MIKIYRKTATIKAEQFDGSDEMVDKYDIINTQLASTAMGFEGAYFLPTLEGELRVNIGDWIASGVEDENWAIADDIFKRTYAELPAIPVFVDKYIKEMKSEGKDLGEALKYWLREDDIDEYMEYNSETFASAWLNGYVVEEDK